MTNAGTTQDNFILPAPPVGGLPLSQDWRDRMKLVHDRTVPVILPSGKNILVDTMFKIITLTDTYNDLATAVRFQGIYLNKFTCNDVYH